MAHVALIGGGGQIALLATARLHDVGHQVTNVVRSDRKQQQIEDAGGTLVLADIEKITGAELAEALRPYTPDVVIFAAGAGGGSGAARKETVDRDGAIKTQQAVAALNSGGDGTTGIRLIQISYIGADVAPPAETGEVFHAYHLAKKAADDALKTTDLDWVILRPGHLIDERASLKVSVSESPERDETSRDNTAAFLAALIDTWPSRQVINLTEGDQSIDEALAELTA